VPLSLEAMYQEHEGDGAGTAMMDDVPKSRIGV